MLSSPKLAAIGTVILAMGAIPIMPETIYIGSVTAIAGYLWRLNRTLGEMRVEQKNQVKELMSLRGDFTRHLEFHMKDKFNEEEGSKS